MSLATREVSWDVGGRRIVDGVTLDVTPGTVVGLLGPNGSGKSSLLRLLAGTRTPTSGQVLLDGDDLRRVRRRDVARRIAVVEQHAQTELDLVVSDVVRLGRIPHRGTWSAESDTDRSAVAEFNTDLFDVATIERAGLTSQLPKWAAIVAEESAAMS